MPKLDSWLDLSNGHQIKPLFIANMRVGFLLRHPVAGSDPSKQIYCTTVIYLREQPLPFKCMTGKYLFDDGTISLDGEVICSGCGIRGFVSGGRWVPTA